MAAKENMNSLIKKPTAWLPLVLTVIILGMMGLYFTGVIPPEPTGDEGIMARSFQLWIALEFFTILLFAIKWLPSDPRGTWKIIALQIALAIVPIAIVWFLEH